MQKQLISRISIFATPLMLTAALLTSVPSARADSGDAPCSDRTLRGDYGFTIEGLIFPAPGVSVPIRGVALTHFDGSGNLSQVDHIIAGGDPVSPLDWTPGTGTYHVNADCTGTIHISVQSTGDLVNLSIVVVKKGAVIQTVVTPPYAGPKRTVTSVGTRVD